MAVLSIDERRRRHQTDPTDGGHWRADGRGAPALDLIPGEYETVIPEDSSPGATVLQVLRESGLADGRTTLTDSQWSGSFPQQQRPQEAAAVLRAV